MKQDVDGASGELHVVEDERAGIGHGDGSLKTEI